jgi:hypothetical protein
MGSTLILTRKLLQSSIWIIIYSLILGIIIFFVYIYLYVGWARFPYLTYTEDKFMGFMNEYVGNVVTLAKNVELGDASLVKSNIGLYQTQHSLDVLKYCNECLQEFYGIQPDVTQQHGGKIYNVADLKTLFDVGGKTPRQIYISDATILGSLPMHNASDAPLDGTDAAKDAAALFAKRLSELLQDEEDLKVAIKAEPDINDSVNNVNLACKDMFKCYSDHFHVSLQDATKYDLESLPELHFLFQFYYEIIEGKSRQFGRLHYYMKALGVSGTVMGKVETYYNKKSTHFEDIDDATMKVFQDLQKKIRALGDACMLVSNKIKLVAYPGFNWDASRTYIMILSLMLQEKDGYIGRKNQIDTINRISNMRKPSGYGDFSLLPIYCGDTIEYCWNEKIMEVWSGYGAKYIKQYEKIQTAMSSDKVTNWFLSIPKKFAGKETFAGLYHKDGDVIEPFVDQLIKMAKTFVAMFTVITGIINVMTDPVAFLKYIIGWVVALVLYLTYFIIYIAVAVVVSHVVMITISIMATCFWFQVLLLNFVFYTILAIIDIITGGFVKKMLRCENLPNAWHIQHGWHTKNTRTRFLFFCFAPCGKKYNAYGYLCLKGSSANPVFAPQQVIFNSFLNASYIAKSNDKLLFGVSPKIEYFSDFDDSQKRAMWETVYADNIDYSKTCGIEYSKYDKMTEAICCMIQKDPSILASNKKNIADVCQSTYCNETRRRNKLLCQDAIPLDIAGQDPSNLLLSFLKLILVICIVLSVFAFAQTKHNVVDKGGWLNFVGNVVRKINNVVPNTVPTAIPTAIPTVIPTVVPNVVPNVVPSVVPIGNNKIPWANIQR